MTLDDIYYVLNRDNNATNVREQAQQDMLAQMKNVRDMPTSQSQANSQADSLTTEEQLFNSIFGDPTEDKSLFG